MGQTDEQDLDNNKHRAIVRVGNTVHRPTNYWTPAVHDVLNYLESINFKYSPRVLGFDEQGREILTFMEGESGKEGWYKVHRTRAYKTTLSYCVNTTTQLLATFRQMILFGHLQKAG